MLAFFLFLLVGLLTPGAVPEARHAEHAAAGVDSLKQLRGTPPWWRICTGGVSGPLPPKKIYIDKAAFRAAFFIPRHNKNGRDATMDTCELTTNCCPPSLNFSNSA